MYANCAPWLVVWLTFWQGFFYIGPVTGRVEYSKLLSPDCWGTVLDDGSTLTTEGNINRAPDQPEGLHECQSVECYFGRHRISFSTHATCIHTLQLETEY